MCSAKLFAKIFPLRRNNGIFFGEEIVAESYRIRFVFQHFWSRGLHGFAQTREVGRLGTESLQSVLGGIILDKLLLVPMTGNLFLQLSKLLVPVEMSWNTCSCKVRTNLNLNDYSTHIIGSIFESSISRLAHFLEAFYKISLTGAKHRRWPSTCKLQLKVTCNIDSTNRPPLVPFCP